MEQKNGGAINIGYEVAGQSSRADIYNEITMGLRQNQVGYNPAVRALQVAFETVEDKETQDFLVKHLKRVVDVLLEQIPNAYKSKITESLLLATRIIVSVIRMHNTPVQMSAFETLALIFDKRKNFYIGQRTVYRNVPGAPEVHAECIRIFIESGGFAIVFEALKNKEWPGAENIKVLLEMCELDEKSTSILDMCSLVIEKTCALSSEALKKENMDDMARMVETVNRMLKMYGKEKSPVKGFNFWLDLNTMYLKCGSLPQRLHAVDQIRPMNQHARRMREPPFGFRAEGSGLRFVNGVYNREGMHKGAPMWKHRVENPEGDEPSVVTMFRCEMRSKQNYWFLSQADEGSPGTDKDIDYYNCKNGDSLPPMTGWTKTKKGRPPCPTLIEIRDPNVTEEERSKSLEQKMLAWIRDVHLIEEIYGDKIHKEVVLRSESVFQFLVDMNSLTMDDLHLVWQRSLDTDEELGSTVKNLLASVAKYMPAKLLKTFLAMVQTTSTENYAAALAFARRLASGETSSGNVRLLLAKGPDATTAILEFLWSLLHNSGSYESEAEEDILLLLEEACSTPEGQRFKKVYVAQCVESIQRSISSDDGINEEVLVRDYTILLQLLNTTDAESLSKLWEGKDTNLKELLKNELAALKSRSESLPEPNYRLYLRKRLDLIRALNGKLSGPRLGKDEIEGLWNLLSSSLERDELINWISSAASTTESMDAAFDDVERRFIFETLICGYLSQQPSHINVSSYGCFRSLFIAVNKESGKLCVSPSMNNNKEAHFDVEDMDLAGLDVLWKLTLLGSEKCYSRTSKLLLALYKNLSNDGDRGVALEQFLDRAFLSMGGDENGAKRSVKLLKDFVSQYSHGVSLPHELCGRGTKVSLSIQVKKITPVTSRVGSWNSQQQNQFVDLPKYTQICHSKMSLKSLIKLIADEHDHPEHKVKLFDRTGGAKQLTNTNLTVGEAGLVDGTDILAMFYAVHGTNVYGTAINSNAYGQRTDPSSDGTSPGDLIASTSKYSEALFDILGETRDTSLRDDVWKFLMSLPTQHEMLSQVGGHIYDHNRDAADSASRWNNLLADQPLFRSIYCLQIIDAYLIPSNADSELVSLWREDFVQSGGFRCVLNLFKSGSMPTAGYTASIRILQNCLIGFEDGTQFSDASKASIMNDVNLEELLGLMIDVVVSSLRSNDVVPGENKSEQQKLLIDTLQILQFILREGADGNCLVEKLFVSNEMKFLIEDIVIKYKSRSVRTRGARLILQVAEATGVMPRLFAVLFGVTDVLSASCGTCSQYFVLLEKLIPKFTADMVSKLVKYLVKSLLSYPRGESPQVTDYEANGSTDAGYLYCFSVGCMNLLANIVKALPGAFKYVVEVSPHFATSLYSDYLFSVPTIDSKSAWPLCRLPQTRASAFTLLTQLVKADRGSLNDVAVLVRAFKHGVRTDKVGWFVESDWNKKEIRYVGLKNQGCTCYMNAVLQQLYLIKEIREGVLSAPVPALKDKTQRKELIDLDTVDPLSLVGKKVELQWTSKRWYPGEITHFDPHTKCHTVKYSDAEVGEFRLSLGRPPVKELPGIVAYQPGPPSKEDAAANVLRQTQTVFRFLKDSEMRFYDPKKFVESCWALQMEYGPYQQNDSDEFLTKLLDKIEYAIKGDRKKMPKTLKWLKDCFGGQMVSQKLPKPENNVCCTGAKVTAQGCTGGKRERNESMICIKLSVPKMARIEDALAKYIQEEIMDGDNKVECESCKDFMTAKGMVDELEHKAYKQATIKRDCFGELPNIMCVALNRFELDYETFETVKRNDRVEFPMVLDMQPYTKEFIEAEAERREAALNAESASSDGKGGSAEKLPANPTRLTRGTSADMDELAGKYAYRLRGVVIHSGIAQGGHYYSLGRVPDNEDEGGDGKWYKFDDDKVTPFPVEKLPDECFGGVEIRKFKRQEWNASAVMAEQEVERMNSALLLFYERILKTESPEEAGDTDLSVEDIEIAEPEPTPLEDTPEYKVWEANSSHVKSSFLFDINYAKFVLELCCSAPTEISSSYTKPVPGEILSTSSSLVSMAIRHLLDVVIRMREKEDLNIWAQTTRRHLSRNVEGACWFLSRLINGEWLREVLLECSDQSTREMLASLIVVAVKTVLPFENDAVESLSAVSYSGALVDLMVSSIKTAAKNWEFYDEFFLLLRDLSSMTLLRYRLINQRTVSQLINLFLNDESPQEIQREFGCITMLGNHMQKPSFQYVLDTLAVLVGVLKTPRDPVIADNTVSKSEIELTPNAKKVFSALFDKFAPTGNMSTDEFIDFCVACGAGGHSTAPRTKIKASKVQDIFRDEKLTENGMMPKDSFLHFYLMATWNSHSTVRRDLRHHKFSDDLLHQGTPTPAEYDLVDVDEFLPALCADAVKWHTFQRKLLTESSTCRMAVPILLVSCLGVKGIERSVNLLRVAVEALTKARNVEGVFDGVVDLLFNVLNMKDDHQEERLRTVFLDAEQGLIGCALRRSNYVGQYSTGASSTRKTFSFIRVVARLLHSDTIREYLLTIRPQWRWMVTWLKDASLKSPELGGKIKTRTRSDEVVSVINALALAQGMPTIEDDMKKYEEGFVVVDGAGDRIVDGTYRFNGFFAEVPKYSMIIEADPADPNPKTMTLTLFRCRLQAGQYQWYLSEMHPVSPGTDKDIDYYLVRSESRIPPTTGWKQAPGKGVAPGPDIRLVNIHDDPDEDYVTTTPNTMHMNYNPQLPTSPDFDDNSSSEEEPIENFNMI